jgi:hypothetical protein
LARNLHSSCCHNAVDSDLTKWVRMPAKKKRRKDVANQTERKDNDTVPCECGWDQCNGQPSKSAYYRHQ